MSGVHDAEDERTEVTEATEAGHRTPVSEEAEGFLVSRRAALVGGTLGVAAMLGVGELETDAALAATTGATSIAQIPLPTTGTAPEQLRLAWGADPSTQVTVSWSTPGTAQAPAPALAYSRAPMSARN